ncbi:RNA-splicing factor [Rhizophlyctis rosea]|nr:RNA-splicing factor [Rhizophlyctis rosea]
MYNGIGLSTARGSGTNGYVQRNLSALRPRDKQPHQAPNFSDDREPPSLLRKPNQDILLHERKRQVEVQCLELRENLEGQDLQEEEIEERVSALREKLLKNLQKMTQDEKTLKEHQVHQLAEAKEKKNAEMQRAFGISKDFVEGAAFDRDLQERLKQERAEKRQQREDQRIQSLIEHEERRKKERLEREEDEKRREKERQKWEEEQREQMRRREEQRRREFERCRGDHYDGRARSDRPWAGGKAKAQSRRIILSVEIPRCQAAASSSSQPIRVQVQVQNSSRQEKPSRPVRIAVQVEVAPRQKRPSHTVSIAIKVSKPSR